METRSSGKQKEYDVLYALACEAEAMLKTATGYASISRFPSENLRMLVRGYSQPYTEPKPGAIGIWLHSLSQILERLADMNELAGTIKTSPEVITPAGDPATALPTLIPRLHLAMRFVIGEMTRLIDRQSSPPASQEAGAK